MRLHARAPRARAWILPPGKLLKSVFWLWMFAWQLKKHSSFAGIFLPQGHLGFKWLKRVSMTSNLLGIITMHTFISTSCESSYTDFQLIGKACFGRSDLKCRHVAYSRFTFRSPREPSKWQWLSEQLDLRMEFNCIWEISLKWSAWK